MADRRDKKLFALANDFVQVLGCQGRSVKPSGLVHVYQQVKHKNLRLRDYGCKKVEDLVQKLCIFEQHGKNGKLSLSPPKLLNFFLSPVLQSQGGSVRVDDLPKCFQETTGLDVQLLYDITGVKTPNAFLIQLHHLCGDAFQLSTDEMSGLVSLVQTVTRVTSNSDVACSTTESNKTSFAADTDNASFPASGMNVQQEPSHVPYTLSPPRHMTLESHMATPSPPPLKKAKQTALYGPGMDMPRDRRYLLNPPVQGFHPPHPRMLPLQSMPRPLPPFMSQTIPRPFMGPVPGVQLDTVPRPLPPPLVTPARPHPYDVQLDPPLNVHFETFSPDSDRDESKPCHAKFRPNMEVPNLPKSMPSQMKGGKKDQQWVNTTLEAMIEELSSKGKFLSDSIVRDLLHDLLRQANRGNPPGSRILTVRDIKAWTDFSKVHGRVQELIKIFCRMTPITSLYELEQAIISTENVDNYEALHLGPLLKHPLAQDFFKPPNDLESIPKVSSFKIYKYLLDFISKSSRRDERKSLEEFLEYMQRKEILESVYHLCVRITSFPLAIQTSYRFRNSQRRERQRRESDMEKEVATILEHEVDKLRRRLSTSIDNDPLSVRKDLAKKDPAQIMFGIFEACQSYFPGFHKAKINDFLHFITQNQRLRKLFVLAIYEGAYGIEKLLPQLAEEHSSHQQQATGGQNQEEHFHQSPGDVLLKLLELLRRTPFPIDLASLARVEKCITEHFSAPAFDSLGNSSFLHFLTAQEKAIKALGGSLIGAHSNSSHTVSTKRRLLELVSQLKQEERKNQEMVASAIKLQFGVTSVEDLGCGNIDKLMAEEEQHQTSSSVPVIAFLSPILVNDEPSLQQVAQPTVGVLGHQTRDDALEILQKAPLLEDLTEWSHWELVYKPQLGNLSDFLHKEASMPGAKSSSFVHALELSPGKLLRICPNSSIQDFIEAVEASDPIGTAGHLVSMIVKRGSVREVSMQLLANRVETALEKLRASTAMDDDWSPSADAATRFVFDCLLRIPLKICNIVASVVFIEPLRKVISTSVAADLLTLCKSTQERQFLQSLGMTVGVKAWADDFKTMLQESVEMATQPLYTSHSVETAAGVTVAHPPSDDQSDEAMDVSSGYQCPTSEAVVELTSSVAEISRTPEELSLSETQCRDIIESIRREEFGVGIELDEKQQEIARRQRMREGRGLKRLSLELYSKDTHFVLELVQNADDNSYHPHLLSGASTEVPALKFIVTVTSVTILNNELGFSESNIRAICDVGRSTKGAHRSGYIGQKGIGFKSVFRVSDTPEIHSNGFHIMFDASSDHVGYILPQWVEKSQYTHEENYKWMTSIVLPLKKNHQTTKKFRDIQPSLLLFLHRLRSITIEDQVSDETRHMTRHDDKHSGITNIRHNDGVDRWLVVRRKLTKAKEYKPDVEATELALAFPLPPDLAVLPLARDLQHQQVFAFLPLRSYGFRFIVQGDFELPSSREDVNSDSPWNQWLREEIPSLFVEAMEMNMKELPGVSPIQAVAFFLQFVPLEGELHDFFRPVSSQILHLLKGKQCLPTEPVDDVAQDSLLSLIKSASSDGKNEEGLPLWKQPSQLLFVRNDFIRRHIPQALLASTLQLSYLHSSLLPAMNPSLQLQLGICNMTIDHLVEVAQAVLQAIEGGDRGYTSEDESSDTDDFSDTEHDVNSPGYSSTSATQGNSLLSWVANWLACVHIVMEEDSDMGVLDKLKQLALLPLEDGTLASTSESALFFPPESSAVGEDFGPLFRELKVVNSSLFSLDDDLTRSRVHKMLQLLGVRNLYPTDIIQHHILPVFTSGKWKSKSKELLCTYLVYIKEKMAERGSGVSETEMVRLLKDCVVLVTNHGSKQPSREVIHFSSAYKPEDDLVTKFPGVNWTTVSPSYLGRSSRIESVSSWRTFLTKLGVKRGIAVERIEEHVTEGMHRWSELHEWRRSPDGAYTVRDYHSKEVDGIISSVSRKPPEHQQSQMKTLAELLDKHWETEYKHYMAEIYDGTNQTSLGGSIQSSFHRTLAQLAWLPPKDNASEKVLYKGSELYDCSRRLLGLLHSHVTYLGADLKNQDFVQLLQIKCSIDTDDLLGFLQKWSKSSTELGVPFYTSIEHMRNVYIYLRQQSDDQQLQGFPPYSAPSICDQLKESDLVFVPDDYSETRGIDNVPGHFYSVHQACWCDPTGVLYRKQKRNENLPSSLPKVLQPHYGCMDSRKNDEIRQAFLQFGVQEQPNTASLIALLQYISSISPTPESYHVEDFTSIAFELVKIESGGSLPPNFIYNRLKNLKVFPTKDLKWVSLADALFEGDDPQLVKQFRDSEGIHFLQWPSNLQSKHKGHDRNWNNQQLREDFTTMCKIPKLSTVAHPRSTQIGYAEPSNELQTKLHYCIPLIQRFLAKYYEQEYSKLKTTMEEKLQRLRVFSVGSLEYIYIVEHDGREIVSSASSLRQSEFEDGDPPAIYVVAKKADRLIFLLPALKKLFLSQDEKEFEKFLSETLLPEEPTSSEELDEIITNSIYDLPPLPADDPIWTIPLPRQQQPVWEEETQEETSDSEEEQFADDITITDEEPSVNTGGLKSWPPCAAVPSDDGSHKMASRAGNAGPPIWPPPPEARDTNKLDVIGKEEIQQVRQKHLQDVDGDQKEGEPAVHHYPASKQQISTSTDATQKKFNRSEEPMSPGASESRSAEPMSAPDRPMSNLGHATRSTTPEIVAPVPIQKQQHHPPGTNPSQKYESQTWKASYHTGLSVVDIKSLMQRVALQDMDHQLLPLIAEDQDEDSRKKVGRWGEEFVYTYLKAKRKLPDGRQFQSIQWVNENSESSKPYDIEIQVENEHIYIEVKSTASAHKELAVISWRELKFAEEQSRHFHLYRVYSAGKASKEIFWLENLFSYLQNNPVRFFFEL